jgi:hypothetical protein
MQARFAPQSHMRTVPKGVGAGNVVTHAAARAVRGRGASEPGVRTCVPQWESH